MPIYCPECDVAVDLPADLLNQGVPKMRCRACGIRYRVLPGGDTFALGDSATTTGTGNSPSATSPPRFSSGLPGISGNSGAASGDWNEGPNLSIPAWSVGRDSAGAGGSGMAGPGSLSGSGSGGRFDYPKLTVGTVFRDKWRIEQQLGEGATAVVYRVTDLDAELEQALKVVGVVGSGADGLRRAWAEEYKSRRRVADGSHLLAIESPAVWDNGSGVTYVALPQELGRQTLRQWLRENRDVEDRERQEQALRLFLEVCLGVEALHHAGLAHLDLKPENILLVEEGRGRDKKLVAKVGDFGLARASGSLRRREGAGTPTYMAPEQVRSAREKEIGTWSDIYALGCILFEVLDGEPPFSGTAEELKRKHLELAPPKLRGVRAHLEQVIRHCLEKERDERPASVTAVRTSLEVNPEEEAAYAEAQQSGTESSWETYLQTWGQGRHGEAGRAALARLVKPRHDAEAAAAKRQREAEEEARRQWAKLGRDTKVPGLGLELVWIEPGSFMMGDDRGEGPIHRVTLTAGYWLGRYPVTRGEYEAVSGEHYLSYFKGSDRLPVENVSWDDATEYCEALNRLHASTLPSGYQFTLPTEAQWEYACRAGSTGEYCYGDGEGQLGSYAWYEDNSEGRTHEVGEKRANRWGLHDMHGNVWEWCQDRAGEYPSGGLTDPTGPGTGSERVCRGGCWYYGAYNAQSAVRFDRLPDDRDYDLGFRVVISSIL